MTHPRFESRFSHLRKRLEKIPFRITFIIMGILATAWFIVRVLPKPSRASYPCMKAAFPAMTSFIIWVLSFTGLFTALKKIPVLLSNAKYKASLFVFILALVSMGIMLDSGSIGLKGSVYNENVEVTHPSNEPFGEAIGVSPGMVVWSWNPDATNENCTNTSDDPFVSDNNTNQDVVDSMISEAITTLGDDANAATAWDAIFKNFNQRKHGVNREYLEGETIFIKINEGTSSWRSRSDLTRKDQSPMTETSPQVSLAILKQLIEIAGIPQEKIWIADPRSHIWQNTYEKLSAVYPNVNYGDKLGEYEGTRSLLTLASEPSLYFSDKGTVITDGISDTFFEEMINADYMINLAALKAHARAGITLTAKNHFGSHSRDGAWHMHPGLIAPENDMVERVDYGMYRVLVDIMGSSVLGGNTLLFLVDGLWSGTEATEYPVKWTMAPFNNDWPNSIFVSMDQVALESVCFDFLRHEAEVGSEKWRNRPNFAQGVDDHLHQAADKKYWPEGISYDPDGTGNPIGSLGVHEHWNNSGQKQYSRNLGKNIGIELVSIPESLVENQSSFEAREALTPPTIDGISDDECWSTVSWNQIDKLWIPWGENNIPFDDFHGKFKIMWSSETNLLYFMVKTYDDIYVDNYVYPNEGYYNFDILELFIDEDQSGGGHIFDTDSENSENAFAHHIAINTPSDGGTVSEAAVCDIAGTGWGDKTIQNYFNHFDDFIVSRTGNELTWEFSLKAYTDAYMHDDPESSRSLLTLGKKIGISLAYCENDTPGTDRDNFIGSVDVSQAAFNNHWKLADDFGKCTLVSAGERINHSPEITALFSNFEFEDRNTEVIIIENLMEYFMDEDGDALSFQANSDNSLLEIKIDGTMLKATALSGFRGPATVTIKATDTQFYQVENTMKLTAINHAPEIITSFDNLTLDELADNMLLVDNLNQIFSDPDGDLLSFSVSSSDTELTAEIIEKKSLTISSTEDFSGPATITVTASDGLLEIESGFEVISTVGISQIRMESSLDLYPVPALDILNIRFSSEYYSPVFIRILSMDGRIKNARNFQKKSNEFMEILDVSGLIAGNYLIELHHEGAIIYKGILKK